MSSEQVGSADERIGSADDRLELLRWGGRGPRVLLVHGSLVDGPRTWAAQRPLGEHRRVEVVQRRGFGAGPPADGDDFERDAEDLLALLADGPAHLVGHSYGAIGCLAAAIRAPHLVTSLTLVEPTCVGISDDPGLLAAVEVIKGWWKDRPADLAEFLTGYSRLLGIRVPRFDRDDREMARAVELLRECRAPWDTDLPCERVREAGVPTLVVSGGHSPPLDAVSAVAAARTGGKHVVLTGAGHAVQFLGPAFNEVLEEMLSTTGVGC
ncbi:MAG TPA: alpha/beta hydrolase [Pseudonocardia sp.]|nr:alpha/beta hydrolase [Pseudonocardia sp.]